MVLYYPYGWSSSKCQIPCYSFQFSGRHPSCIWIHKHVYSITLPLQINQFQPFYCGEKSDILNFIDHPLFHFYFFYIQMAPFKDKGIAHNWYLPLHNPCPIMFHQTITVSTQSLTNFIKTRKVKSNPFRLFHLSVSGVETLIKVQVTRLVPKVHQ